MVLVDKAVVLEAWAHVEKIAEALRNDPLPTDMEVVKEKLMELQLATAMAVTLLERHNKDGKSAPN